MRWSAMARPGCTVCAADHRHPPARRQAARLRRAPPQLGGLRNKSSPLWCAPITDGVMEEFSSNGVRIAFIDEKPENDRGEPILLIHGFASTHAVNWLFPLWVRTLTGAGRRVIALDNRGHGRSEKLYDPKDYHTATMAEDSRNLLDHLGIDNADVMGYSMDERTR